MATTYTLISSVTVGSGGAANMEFTSIPADYTDLLVKISSRYNVSDNWTNLDFRMNGLSTSIYSARVIYGTGSATASTSEAPRAEAALTYQNANNSTASTFSNVELYFPNYTSSNNKSVSIDFVTENNATAALAGLNAVLMASTSAITSLNFFSRDATNFMQYSTAYLYGISNA
jgi:hypothetical protein